MRIGIGHDAHRLTENRPLILGGVLIPYELGLQGVSDADVLVHAIIDALFGAACMGDIGTHFPPSDEKYKGIDSMILLSETVKLLGENGFEIENIDSTIVAQKPKMASYIPLMREKIAQVCGVDISKISVKATTTEKMGYEGRGEGISAMAVCLLNNK